MKRHVVIAVLMISLGVISCGKRYVGQRINPAWTGWCHYLNGEKHCTKELGALIFDFTIKEGDVEGDFIIEGYLDASKGEIKSWDKMLEGQSHFSMIVADDGVVVDNVAFRPRPVYGELGSTIPFKIEYNRPGGFDAISFYWKMLIKG